MDINDIRKLPRGTTLYHWETAGEVPVYFLLVDARRKNWPVKCLRQTGETAWFWPYELNDKPSSSYEITIRQFVRRAESSIPLPVKPDYNFLQKMLGCKPTAQEEAWFAEEWARSVHAEQKLR